MSSFFDPPDESNDASDSSSSESDNNFEESHLGLANEESNLDNFIARLEKYPKHPVHGKMVPKEDLEELMRSFPSIYLDFPVQAPLVGTDYINRDIINEMVIPDKVFGSVIVHVDVVERMFICSPYLTDTKLLQTDRTNLIGDDDSEKESGRTLSEIQERQLDTFGFVSSTYGRSDLSPEDRSKRILQHEQNEKSSLGEHYKERMVDEVSVPSGYHEDSISITAMKNIKVPRRIIWGKPVRSKCFPETHSGKGSSVIYRSESQTNEFYPSLPEECEDEEDLNDSEDQGERFTGEELGVIYANIEYCKKGGPGTESKLSQKEREDMQGFLAKNEGKSYKVMRSDKSQYGTPGLANLDMSCNFRSYSRTIKGLTSFDHLRCPKTKTLWGGKETEVIAPNPMCGSEADRLCTTMIMTGALSLNYVKTMFENYNECVSDDGTQTVSSRAEKEVKRSISNSWKTLSRPNRELIFYNDNECRVMMINKDYNNPCVFQENAFQKLIENCCFRSPTCMCIQKDHTSFKNCGNGMFINLDAMRQKIHTRSGLGYSLSPMEDCLNCSCFFLPISCLIFGNFHGCDSLDELHKNCFLTTSLSFNSDEDKKVPVELSLTPVGEYLFFGPKSDGSGNNVLYNRGMLMSSLQKSITKSKLMKKAQSNALRRRWLNIPCAELDELEARRSNELIGTLNLGSIADGERKIEDDNLYPRILKNRKTVVGSNWKVTQNDDGSHRNYYHPKIWRNQEIAKPASIKTISQLKKVNDEIIDNCKDVLDEKFDSIMFNILCPISMKKTEMNSSVCSIMDQKFIVDEMGSLTDISVRPVGFLESLEALQDTFTGVEFSQESRKLLDTTEKKRITRGRIYEEIMKFFDSSYSVNPESFEEKNKESLEHIVSFIFDSILLKEFKSMDLLEKNDLMRKSMDLFVDDKISFNSFRTKFSLVILHFLQSQLNIQETLSLTRKVISDCSKKHSIIRSLIENRSHITRLFNSRNQLWREMLNIGDVAGETFNPGKHLSQQNRRIEEKIVCEYSAAVYEFLKHFVSPDKYLESFIQMESLLIKRFRISFIFDFEGCIFKLPISGTRIKMLVEEIEKHPNSYWEERGVEVLRRWLHEEEEGDDDDDGAGEIPLEEEVEEKEIVIVDFDSEHYRRLCVYVVNLLYFKTKSGKSLLLLIRDIKMFLEKYPNGYILRGGLFSPDMKKKFNEKKIKEYRDKLGIKVDWKTKKKRGRGSSLQGEKKKQKERKKKKRKTINNSGVNTTKKKE